ncbi:hypothetical protein ABTZ58_35430 [Streptomyces sp. NPDC094143]|uniref:hypothetical protein n=1 Tax=Streptomyces sp. NPDC094143 TaxID=3155310 RepID=UPI003332D69F
MKKFLGLFAAGLVVAAGTTVSTAAPASAAATVTTFKNQYSNLCLGDDNGDVKQLSCSDARALWFTSEQTVNPVRMSNFYTGRCLWGGDTVKTVPCNQADPAQQWNFDWHCYSRGVLNIHPVRDLRKHLTGWSTNNDVGLANFVGMGNGHEKQVWSTTGLFGCGG